MGVMDSKEIVEKYKQFLFKQGTYEVVMENQKDLVEVVHTLRAVLCVKGA